MRSRIDEQLTAEERLVLKRYRTSHRRDFRKRLVLSVGYAVGAGVFAVLAVVEGEPAYVMVVYGVLLVVPSLALWRGHRLVRVVPGIPEKYERAIASSERRETTPGSDG